jgi:hypothetical protein
MSKRTLGYWIFQYVVVAPSHAQYSGRCEYVMRVEKPGQPTQGLLPPAFNGFT